MNTRTTLLVAALVALAACSSKPAANGGDSTNPAATSPAPSAGAEADSAAVARLEAEARAMVSDSGCASDAQCATAPLGVRACGGPREYLVYCRLTTDSTRLFAKLAELEKTEKAWNDKRGAMSTCEFREAPKVGVVAGKCTAR